MARETASFGNLSIEYVGLDTIVPDPRNARKHSKRQLVRLTAGMKEFGVTNPLLIDEKSKIIAGHARLEAAKALRLEKVPCIRLDHLNEAQKTALAIADNKLGDMSHFDPDLLAKQLAELCALDFNIELTGFETAEVDILLEPPRISATDPADSFAAPDPNMASVSRAGDLWICGAHRLLCGDALDADAYSRLLASERADMVFTDPPYNVPIQGHVSGLGRARHREFAMASGEMSRDEFTRFLTSYMEHLAQVSTNGSIHFHCMDWRHLREIMDAGEAVYTELKALCVWNKTNGGMGSLYRSKHELVLAYKNGTAPHVNNVELGRLGRYRTNVWDYAGANTFRSGRTEELALHPTVKPVSLVADAIRDCSKRGALVLDPFAGSGTIILAAERTGRRAAALELDPLYVDTAIRRWQTLTGGEAILADEGSCFDEVADARAAMEADHG